MAIYEPIIDSTGIYSGGVGKDAPYGKATGLYKPKIPGPGGRLGGLIQGASKVGNFLFANKRKLQGPAVVIGGHLVASNYKQHKALRATSTGKYSRRGSRQNPNRRSGKRSKHICCGCCGC